MNPLDIAIYFSKLHQLHAPPYEVWQSGLIPHPEVPARVDAVQLHLGSKGFGLVEESRILPRETLENIHDPTMLKWIEEKSASIKGPEYQFPSFFPIREKMRQGSFHHGGYAYDLSAPIGKGTWRAILSSASCAYYAAEKIQLGETTCAVSLGRSPGHHAGYDFYGGFCYINNAAVAADLLSKKGTVALLDLDSHHGNGTQDIFWNNPDVVFASIHGDTSFEYPFYGGTQDEKGGPNAYGRTINVPLSEEIKGPRFLRHLKQILEALNQFNPTTLVISMGFDTYKEDPFCSLMRLEVEDYFKIGESLAHFNRPTLFILEGGYNTEALPILIDSLLKGFMSIKMSMPS